MVRIESAANDTAADRSGNPLDMALGSRIRLRRRQLHYSQDQLAQRVGVTFQQIQKYENGSNRVSFSRLVEIAGGLECSLFDLVGDLVEPNLSPAVVACNTHLGEVGVVELLEYYSRIQSPSCRRALINLAKELADRIEADAADTPPSVQHS